MTLRKRSLTTYAIGYVLYFVGWFFVELTWNHDGWADAAFGALIYATIVQTAMVSYELMRERRRRRLDRGPVRIASRPRPDGPVQA